MQVDVHTARSVTLSRCCSDEEWASVEIGERGCRRTK